MKQDWNKVYVEYVDEANESFLSITTAFYKKNCKESSEPLVRKVVNQKFAEKR